MQKQIIELIPWYDTNVGFDVSESSGLSIRTKVPRRVWEAVVKEARNAG